MVDDKEDSKAEADEGVLWVVVLHIEGCGVASKGKREEDERGAKLWTVIASKRETRENLPQQGFM
jgi:hypothetical protein